MFVCSFTMNAMSKKASRQRRALSVKKLGLLLIAITIWLSILVVAILSCFGKVIDLKVSVDSYEIAASISAAENND